MRDAQSLISYFTSDAIANMMKFTDRRYRSGEYVAEVLMPIRNLETFFKTMSCGATRRVSSLADIVENGVITDVGYRLILSLVGGKLLENGVQPLMSARTDIPLEDKAIIINKFSMFSSVGSQTLERDKRLVHLVDGVLQLVDGATGVQLLGTRVRAVHDRVAAVQLVGVVQTLQTLLRHLVTRVRDPTVRLLEDGGTQILVGVPPVGRTRRRAASAQNALVQTVQLLAILVRLEILHLVIGIHLRLLLQPRLDRRVLLVEVSHVRDQILDHEHVGQRTDGHGLVSRSDLGQTSETVLTIDVHGARSANTLTAGSRMNFPAPSIPPKRKRRVDIVLDLEQGIQHHGSAATVKTESHTLLVHVDSVTRHLRLLIDLRAITEDIEELVRRLFNEMFRKTPPPCETWAQPSYRSRRPWQESAAAGQRREQSFWKRCRDF